MGACQQSRGMTLQVANAGFKAQGNNFTGGGFCINDLTESCHVPS